MKSIGISVRAATEGDAKAIASLVVELGYSADEEVVRERLSRLVGRSDYLVAVAQSDGGEICGWLQAHSSEALESGSRVEIVGLATAQQMRRRGIGRLLVECAESWAIRVGAQVVVVRSNVKRVESHGFYVALGYANTKTQNVYRKRVTSKRKDHTRMNWSKMITAAAASALVIMAAGTVSHGQSNKNSTSPDIQKAVLARLAEIQNAAQALDPDKVFSFVLENDTGALAQNGKLFLTRKEALESTKRGFQGLQKVDYRFEQQHVTLLSPTVALATGEGSSSATTDDGRIFTTRFAQSVVLVLTNGEWMVFHAHRSVPPAR